MSSRDLNFKAKRHPKIGQPNRTPLSLNLSRPSDSVHLYDSFPSFPPVSSFSLPLPSSCFPVFFPSSTLLLFILFLIHPFSALPYSFYSSILFYPFFSFRPRSSFSIPTMSSQFFSRFLSFPSLPSPLLPFLIPFCYRGWWRGEYSALACCRFFQWLGDAYGF